MSICVQIPDFSACLPRWLTSMGSSLSRTRFWYKECAFSPFVAHSSIFAPALAGFTFWEALRHDLAKSAPRFFETKEEKRAKPSPIQGIPCLRTTSARSTRRLMGRLMPTDGQPAKRRYRHKKAAPCRGWLLVCSGTPAGHLRRRPLGSKARRELCYRLWNRTRAFAVGVLQQVFWPSKKPAEIAGFSVNSLVALPGIEPGF
jgi:hypothetical protein